ncbi:ABC transporter substrate-binding protein [Piscinibacter sp. HJYY11]|uniref:ABC transporter substrate-binding protein n=1 Tax=Piscinibacter sp. HJYY11 TaxID=2801333 RepID=UPI0019203A7C|nr:ABC transporter substrate-binding protein [Piscinibacter sp. HJYY11]MBL0729612.1 carbohydrate ABC transporter substrate-binding protein [Piscinibacter sp. HJYY11]
MATRIGGRSTGTFLCVIALSTPLWIPNAFAQPRAELLHWWTSPGEAAAAEILSKHVRRSGVQYVDSPVLGGGGSSAMKTLRARVKARNAPTAVQITGLEVAEWGERDALNDIDALARAERWSEVVPKPFQRYMKFQGRWVGVAPNVHSTNWVWANTDVLAKVGITQPPRTWREFVGAARKAQSAGFVGLAYGGQTWQSTLIFDSALLGAGGPDFYRKLFIEGRRPGNAHAVLEQAYARMSELRDVIDDQSANRPWNLATAMVINGRAAFQIMGDWARPEFTVSGKQVGRDFWCFRVPGTEDSVTFNLDTFAMFKVEGAEKVQGQQIFAKTVMSPAFQTEFNVAKGSVPTRSDIAGSAFEECGRRAVQDIAKASKRQTLLGSMALGHALGTEQKDALSDVIHRHFSGFLSDKDAATESLRAIAR